MLGKNRGDSGIGNQNVNIRQIEVFHAVMEAGSVTGAAAALRVSQPSVSKHLRLLEADLGFDLFERFGNRLTATTEAEALFHKIERTYQGLSHLSRFAESLKNHPSGETSAAAMPLLARRWLPDVVSPFLLEHAGASIALPVRSSHWIMEATASGKIDIGLVLDTGEDIDTHRERLMRIPLVCAFQSGHPFNGRDRISVSDLSGETLITLSNFDQWRLTVETELEAAGIRPTRRVDTFTTQIACELAARGSGVTVVDLLTAIEYQARGLEWRPFEPELSFDIALIRPLTRTRSRLSNELVQRLKEAAMKTQDELIAAQAGDCRRSPST